MPRASIPQPSNRKLGPHVYSWSLPAGKCYSCIGETRLCRGVCYGCNGFFIMPSVQTSHKQNFEFSKTDEFTQWAISRIDDLMIATLRIHVSGDFYSPEYLYKWVDIVNASPNTQFYAYTRSWRDDTMLHGFAQLNGLKNMELWWSTDRETGDAPAMTGVRTAYMAVNDIDAMTAPAAADLVFRVRPKTKMLFANGVKVCPTETGVTYKRKPTCSRCKLCFQPADVKTNVPKTKSKHNRGEVYAGVESKS